MKTALSHCAITKQSVTNNEYLPQKHIGSQTEGPKKCFYSLVLPPVESSGDYYYYYYTHLSASFPGQPG